MTNGKKQRKEERKIYKQREKRKRHITSDEEWGRLTQGETKEEGERERDIG